MGSHRRPERRWWRGAAIAALLLLPATLRAQSAECDAGEREVRSLGFRGNQAFRGSELTEKNHRNLGDLGELGDC